MGGLVMKLRAFSKIIESAMMLYNRVVVLPSPRFFSPQSSLSCIMFSVRDLLVARGDPDTCVWERRDQDDRGVV